MTPLPSGAVTFVFTDIQGSTSLFHQLGDDYLDLLGHHHNVVRRAISDHEGIEMKTEGDAFFIAFADAPSALAACLQVQLDMHKDAPARRWPIRVRIGMHSGPAHIIDDDYVGLAVHEAARIASAAHGGQVLLSGTTACLVDHSMPDRAGLCDLGLHVLKDFPQPRRLFQLTHPDLDDAFPAPRTLSASTHNLPIPPNPIVGRRTELSTIQKLLLGDARLVTLTGVGGIGKTRLALEASRSLLAYFSGGVWISQLAAVSDPSKLLEAIASTLGVSDKAGQSPLDVLVDRLSKGPVLVLLDNLEQVLDGAQQVTELLSFCPELRVLATSRERLHVRGEHVVDVGTLATPPPTARLADLKHIESVALFTQRTEAVVPRFRLDASNAASVMRICCSLEGIPLALELAAAGVADLGLEGVHDGLERALDLLTGGQRDLPPRQRSLRAAFEWSYSLLDVSQRSLFEQLSVFAGGFSASAASAVTGAAEFERQATTLVAKSLLACDGPTERLTMLEPLRQFAAEKLQQSLDAERLREAHAAWFGRLASEGSKALTGPDQAHWVPRLETEIDNLRAALENAPPEDALAMATDLVRFWTVRGLWAEGRAWLERLLAVTSTVSALRPWALVGLGQIARLQADYDVAVEALKSSMAAINKRRDEHVELRALALLQLAEVARIKADYAHAEHLLEEALVLTKEAGTIRVLGKVLTSMGAIAFVSGDLVTARARLGEALRVLTPTGDHATLATAETNLGLTCLKDNDPNMAVALLQSATERLELLSDRNGAAIVRANLGMAAFELGDAEGARAAWEMAAGTFEESGSKLDALRMHMNLAMVFRNALNDENAATYHLARVISLDAELGGLDHTGAALDEMGELALSRQRRGRAERIYKRLRENRHAAGDKAGEKEAARILSELAQAQPRS